MHSPHRGTNEVGALGEVAARSEEDMMGGGERRGKLAGECESTVTRPSGAFPHPWHPDKEYVATAGLLSALMATDPYAGLLRWRGPLHKTASKATRPSQAWRHVAHSIGKGLIIMRPRVFHQASPSLWRVEVKACMLFLFHPALMEDEACLFGCGLVTPSLGPKR
jgi:hypothetical protein